MIAWTDASSYESSHTTSLVYIDFNSYERFYDLARLVNDFDRWFSRASRRHQALSNLLIIIEQYAPKLRLYKGFSQPALYRRRPQEKRLPTKKEGP